MKVDELRRRLSERVIVGDGGMGSELLQRLPEGSRLDVAAHEHPKEVLDVHLAYIEAGAELIETATFGSSRPRMARGRVGDLTEKANAQAVKLAREAREISGRDVLVAGSIAPLAGVLDLDEPEGRAMIPTAHAEQAAILAGRGADLLILETFFRVDEMVIAVAAARSVTDLPLIGMMTFAHERPPHPYLEQAAMIDELAELDLVAIGVNCAPGPMGAIEILRHVRQDRLPVATSPNAGMLVRREGRILMPPATPSYLARFARQAVGLGAALVGGCCGTGAEHIRAIAEAVRDLKLELRTGTSVVVPESLPAPEPVRPSSSLASKLERGRFVRLVQLDPPKGTNAEAILDAASAIGAHPDVDAVDINSNPLARLRMDPLFLGQLIQQRTGVEAVPHVTPRDASLMGLQSQLLGAWTGGIRNVLAITGDPSQLGDFPGVHDVYHVDIFELVRAPRRYFRARAGALADGRRLRLRRQSDRGSSRVPHRSCGQPCRRRPDEGGRPPATEGRQRRPLRHEPGVFRLGDVGSIHRSLRRRAADPDTGRCVAAAIAQDLEAAGADAAEVGYGRAVKMLREAQDRAAGAYLIAPFKQPQAILPIVDDAQSI
jgi:homocysteine S-methyltransferase